MSTARRRQRWVSGALLLAGLLLPACHAPRPTVTAPLATYDDAPWGATLAGVVEDGLVDYGRLRTAHADDLERYLDAVARFGPRSTPARFPTRADELAYYLNAYNAIMLRRWLDAGAGDEEEGAPPDRRSVNILWFMVDHYRVDGRWMSMNTLEQGVIRGYDEPRIHFALVCGAISCPPLSDEPYEGARLDEQLEARGRRWLRDEADGFVIDEDGTPRLSLIFQWYFNDFRADGMMPGLLRRYLDPDDPRLPVALAALEDGSAGWLPYSWVINDARLHRPGRSENDVAPDGAAKAASPADG